MSLIKLAQEKKNSMTFDTLTGAAKGAFSGVLGLGTIHAIMHKKLGNLSKSDHAKAVLAATLAGGAKGAVMNMTHERRERLMEQLKKIAPE